MVIVINNAQLSKNFNLTELKCKCGCNKAIIDMLGINLLQKIREHFKKPVYVVSAYRCVEHNKAVGGAENSYHMQGLAYDIKIVGVSPLAVAQIAIDVGFTGIGVYTNNGNSFTHVDTRKTRTYWHDQKGNKELTIITKL